MPARMLMLRNGCPWLLPWPTTTTLSGELVTQSWIPQECWPRRSAFARCRVRRQRVPAEQESLFQRPGSLYYGDNLAILRERIKSESVDLVYLDPPFNSNRSYNIIFRERDKTESAAQARAFEDYWQWNPVAARTFRDLTSPGAEARGVPPNLVSLMEALRQFIGEGDMLAYLSMMAIRLVELRRVLKPTGSLFLHCDPTASHYLKLILDAIFGHASFRNEVIWRYRRWPTKATRFQRMHDVLLFYAARPDGTPTFHTLYGYEELAPSTLKTFGKKKQRADFSSGHRKPGVIDEETQGPPLSDVWDIGVIAPISKERTGYPTQKPLALLERVILSCSNPGDVVLDPFCGCGTTISAAQKFGRRWIGIDVTYLAIEIIKNRLAASFPGEDLYREYGAPTDLEGARQLAETDPLEFQRWVVPVIGAQHAGEDAKLKLGPDRGIDGYIRFQDDPTGKSKRVLISVKSGGTGPRDVRDLRGTMEREGAPIGVMVTLQPPTREMRLEAARAGAWSSPVFDPHREFDRIQFLTIAEILKGARPSYPGQTKLGRSTPPPAAVEAPRLGVRKAKARGAGLAKASPRAAEPKRAARG